MRNEPNLPTQHVKSLNAARYVRQRNTLRLNFNHVMSGKTSRQKVCKNVQKVLVLLSAVANLAIDH